MKTRITLVIHLAIAGLLLSAAPVFAQQPQPPSQPQAGHPPHPPMGMNDPMGDVMFPPELIMGHLRELALTDEQKLFARAEIQKTTMRFNELQWQLQDAMELLHETLKANSINEQQALAQLDKVLDAEREIKRLHFGLVIALKNKLTPEQQNKLHEMMMRMHGADGGARKGPESDEP
jgi:Spy/CpxP family protein refolding chaperone